MARRLRNVFAPHVLRLCGGLIKEVSLERFSIKHRTQHQFIDDHVLVRNVSKLVVTRIMYDRRNPSKEKILGNSVPAEGFILHWQVQSASGPVKTANDR